MIRIRSKKKNGFTMIELMIVVVIVGVLAAIAIPIYGKYIKNSRMTEASARIGEILTASKAYAQENDTDDNGVGNWPLGAGGIVDLSGTENFTYEITAGAGLNADGIFAVRATGINKMVGAFLTITLADINSNGEITENTLP